MPVAILDAESPARRLYFMPMMQGNHKFAAQQALAASIHLFLSSLSLTLPPSSTPGISWLELFALFELRGNNIDRHETGMNKCRTSLREGLSKFKALARYIDDNCVQRRDQYFSMLRRPSSGVSKALPLSKTRRPSGVFPS